MPPEDRICPICFGPMGKTASDICCTEEDKYLLICAKGALREFEDRSATIENVVDYLYERLAELLLKRGESITDYDESGVLAELERRVLRWIKKEMISSHSVRGIAFCQECGVPIMVGRTYCAQCGGSKQTRGTLGNMSPGAGPTVHRGMHFKRE